MTRGSAFSHLLVTFGLCLPFLFLKIHETIKILIAGSFIPLFYFTRLYCIAPSEQGRLGDSSCDVTRDEVTDIKVSDRAEITNTHFKASVVSS